MDGWMIIMMMTMMIVQRGYTIWRIMYEVYCVFCASVMGLFVLRVLFVV